MQGRKLVFTTAAAVHYELGYMDLNLRAHIASVVKER